jgi:hypothetical protein
VLIKSVKTGKVFNVITNPVVNNNLQLKIETNQSFSLRLLNSFGQIVYQNKYNSSIGKIISVSTNNFAKGMYTVQINTASEQQVEKLIIQ